MALNQWTLQAALSGTSTKLTLLTNALASDIFHGKYPVDDLLPSEHELVKTFGVSRNTVRSALKKLQEIGLITTRRGVGHTVRARESQVQYAQSFDSIADLQQYASSTRVVINSRDEFVVDKGRAAWLGCKPGESWWLVRTTRYPKTSQTAIAVCEIFIPCVYATVLAGSGQDQLGIFEKIEALRGESFSEIQQDITAGIATASEARQLGIPPRSPVLILVRRYFGSGREILEIARSVHSAKSFSYSMKVHLKAGAPKSGGVPPDESPRRYLISSGTTAHSPESARAGCA